MLRASAAFLVLGMVSLLMGATGVSRITLDLGKFLFLTFLILSALSFIAALVIPGKWKGDE